MSTRAAFVIGLSLLAGCYQGADDAGLGTETGAGSGSASDPSDGPGGGPSGGRGGSSDDDTTEGTSSDPGSADETAGADDDSSTGPPPEPVSTIAEQLVPFDANQQDLTGPASWSNNYGKSPEIIAVPDGSGLDVLAQDQEGDALGRAVLFRLSRADDDYVVTRVVEPPVLDRIMGLARGPQGALYVASGAAESDDITLEYPAAGQYREGVVRVVKVEVDDSIAFDTDLDVARQSFAGDPEQLINPMVAASSRLAFGGGRVALLHGLNTNPDNKGVRHQKAITTHLDANSGEVVRASSIWVSHSFDQRLFHDGQGFIEMHLGDAFPRHIAFARIEPDSGEVPLFHIKGGTGDNVTRTRLGNAVMTGDAAFGYLAVFASERTTGVEPLAGGPDAIAGSREIGLVRIRSAFEVDGGDGMAHLDPALPDTQAVNSGEADQTNRLRWLTNYEGESSGSTHAERPKLVWIDDAAVVLWERFDGSADDSFAGTWAMTVDAAGEPIAEPTMVSGSRLPRGDDAFALRDEAGWITGDGDARSLTLHLVDAALGYRTIVVE